MITDDRVIELGLAEVAKHIKAGNHPAAHVSLNTVFWVLENSAEDQAIAA